jgi:hypothetical protein
MRRTRRLESELRLGYRTAKGSAEFLFLTMLSKCSLTFSWHSLLQMSQHPLNPRRGGRRRQCEHVLLVGGWRELRKIFWSRRLCFEQNSRPVLCKFQKSLLYDKEYGHRRRHNFVRRARASPNSQFRDPIPHPILPLDQHFTLPMLQWSTNT